MIALAGLFGAAGLMVAGFFVALGIEAGCKHIAEAIKSESEAWRRQERHKDRRG